MISRPTANILRTPLLLGLLVASAFLFQAASRGEQALPVHGAVFAWAEAHPDEPVPLIVQHDGTPGDLLGFVRSSGGAVEREFTIIPAVDVAIPTDRVDELARQDDVNWVSLDAPVYSTGTLTNATALSTAYPYAINAPAAWQSTTGEGVTVAVIDTGVSGDAQSDFLDPLGRSRLQGVSPNPALDPAEDGFGHGTHVGGIIGGYSAATAPAGKYTGIAPGANVIGVRIADDAGNATVGDLIAGLQWIDENRSTYNIRVLNLSVNSSVAQSYTVDPLDAAVEILWFHDIAVVVASGNNGDAADAVHYPPANDPFVITVGAFDDQGTVLLADDALAPWSSRGTTQDGVAKPDVLAPGANIVAPVSATSYLATHYPSHVVEGNGTQAYFRMSGTSMATPVVAGLAALILEDHPQWRPGHVKAALVQTARSVKGQGKGVLADQAVAYLGAPATTDDGLRPSFPLLSALGVADADHNNVRYRDALFDGIRWAGLELNGIRWLGVDWNGIRWTNIQFEGIRWTTTEFTGIRWSGFVTDEECDDAADACTIGGIGNASDAADTGRDHANERAFEGGNNAGRHGQD